MSEKSPAKYPAIVYQHRIQILANGEALVRSGKARTATAKDAALSGQSVDKAALTAAAELQVSLDAEATEKAAAKAAAEQAAAAAAAKKKQG